MISVANTTFSEKEIGTISHVICTRFLQAEMHVKSFEKRDSILCILAHAFFVYF